MDFAQFESLTRVEIKTPGVSFAECQDWFKLTAQDAFTLLYGYDVDRNTWHVYVKDGKIHRHIYRDQWDEATLSYRTRTLAGSSGQEEWKDASLLVPSKRLYPERCHYLFCALLKAKGIYLTFTTFNEQVYAENVERFGEGDLPLYGEVM